MAGTSYSKLASTPSGLDAKGRLPRLCPVPRRPAASNADSRTLPLVLERPMAGTASRALAQIRRRRPEVQQKERHRLEKPKLAPPICCPTLAEDEHFDNSVAAVGFARLVYHRARVLREDRSNVINSRLLTKGGRLTLKQVAHDIAHSVRVCLRAKRFIALMEPGMPNKVWWNSEVVLEAPGACQSFGDVLQPRCNNMQIDCDWHDLLKDLSPLSPVKARSFYPRSSDEELSSISSPLAHCRTRASPRRDLLKDLSPLSPVLSFSEGLF